MKVAIFGGSFNPVHNEHINIVKAAINELSLDKVIIMPSNITPAKNGRMFASARDRLNMCKLAFKSVPETEVSDFEIEQSGVSYSYLTCRRFVKRYPDAERYFIVGGDMFENFHKWKYPEEILKCVTLAVCARGCGDRLNTAVKDFYSRFKKEVSLFGYVGKNVSSTRIRVYAALCESITGLVNDEVAQYIADNSLYYIYGAKDVKKTLSQYRWRHTVGVAVTAAENCTRYNVAERDAVTAALFHDCGKELDPSPFCVPDNVPLPVVHQYIGAQLAEKVYRIDDKNVLDAIKYHCSGRDNMSPLEKLIYLSDMVEEGRDYDGVNELRSLFQTDKEEAFYSALEQQFERLKTSGLPVYRLTQKAYEYAKEQRNDKQRKN